MIESPVYGREEGKRYEVGRVLLVGHDRVPESRELYLVRRQNHLSRTMLQLQKERTP